MQKQTGRMSFMELLIVLALVAILGTIAAPTVAHSLDVMNVRAAREELFGLAARTRDVAVSRSGATLSLDLRNQVARIIDGASVAVEELHLQKYDVSLATDGRQSSIALRYDARGIGRMASRTIRLRRGSAEAGLTFSSYGRVRRW